MYKIRYCILFRVVFLISAAPLSSSDNIPYKGAHAYYPVTIMLLNMMSYLTHIKNSILTCLNLFPPFISFVMKVGCS
jgi:hypothetical protein